MKKTHRTALRIMGEHLTAADEVYDGLKKIYPEMRWGINRYNVRLLLDTLDRKGYIYFVPSSEGLGYRVTKKGRAYLKRFIEAE